MTGPDANLTKKYRGLLRESNLERHINSIHFQYTLLLGNFLFLYCNESVLFFLILNIQSGRFEFVKKFVTVRL
jgi:hypothetical protein